MTAELCSSSSFQGKQSNPAHSEKLWGKMLTHSSNSSPAQANITGAKVVKKKNPSGDTMRLSCSVSPEGSQRSTVNNNNYGISFTVDVFWKYQHYFICHLKKQYGSFRSENPFVLLVFHERNKLLAKIFIKRNNLSHL